MVEEIGMKNGKPSTACHSFSRSKMDYVTSILREREELRNDQ